MIAGQVWEGEVSSNRHIPSDGKKKEAIAWSKGRGDFMSIIRLRVIGKEFASAPVCRYLESVGK